jgi:hypothetical protein
LANDASRHDSLPRRRKRKDGGGPEKPKAVTTTGRMAAYGRAAFAWAAKRDAVRVNPFADLPVAKSIAKRERITNAKWVAGPYCGRALHMAALRKRVRSHFRSGVHQRSRKWMLSP